MFRDEKLEMKVGIFIGVGIFLMFLIVFSISDFYVFEKGYNIKVVFDYVNGIEENAPVRLAGVHVGEVKSIEIYYDSEASQTRVKLDAWIKESIKIEKDAVARINTLGLLGEQYVEISPGKETRFLTEGDVIAGKDPMNVGQQVEKMNDFFVSASEVVQKVSKGEGTLGKLLSDDTIYNDLEIIFGRLKDGQGTIGKLLVEEKIYDDMEEFVSDIKANPWKLLHKPSGASSRSKKGDAEKKGTSVGTK